MNERRDAGVVSAVRSGLAPAEIKVDETGFLLQWT